MSKENEELLNMGMVILKRADASKLESVNVESQPFYKSKAWRNCRAGYIKSLESMNVDVSKCPDGS